MKNRQIKAFLAIAEELHFRKAADKLGLTQPALSLAMKTLEEEIGVELLLRDRHQTRLTYAGEVFRAEITEMLACAEQASERVRRASTGIISQLKIGFISTATTADFLPRLISEFRAVHPGVALSLQNSVTIDLLTMIKAGTLDIAFIRLPLIMPHDVEMASVYTERHALLVPADNPLARQEAIRSRDLQGSPFIMYARRNAPGYHDLIMRSLNSNAIHPLIVQEVGEMYTMVALVAAGIGIAVAPISTRNYQLPGVVFHDASWLPAAEIAIAFRKDDTRPATRLFIDLTRRAQRAAAENQPMPNA
ncbi:MULTISPECIES: LysR family transcriptional regulator [Rhodopseudomonas]|uniref:LysR family transcriptional regulator n=1 Tax=Rhodopseudomonas TaxID=1073 RepID=UPI0006973366|nr:MULTISPECIES: LysR family transcriptional regulator [Rhodopseudomonas]MDF3812444.1 LysR family transcriptional regulator [Rhodopseudomonas sp. BAL398]WOK19443.1 LysR family transcriptional regulator [Rhodopseudomonas sp. BAL398]